MSKSAKRLRKIARLAGPLGTRARYQELKRKWKETPAIERALVREGMEAILSKGIAQPAAKTA